MSKITWDAVGERLAETGVKQGVLYNWNNTTKAFDSGVGWNGLTGVSEAPTGAESTPFYADDQKYIELSSLEEFAGSISAYTYPDEYKRCIGEVEVAPGVSLAQQTREIFGFAYMVTQVNDTLGTGYGYKLHLVYNARASVSEADHATMNDSPELVEFSWDFTTTPAAVTGFKPTAHIIIDSTKFLSTEMAKLEALLDILYGTDADGEGGTGTEPRLPMPDEIISMFATP